VSFTRPTDFFGGFLPSFKSHIGRTIYGDPFDGSYDITGPQMVLVMKLTTFAWNVGDGRRPVEVCAFSLCPIRPRADRLPKHAYEGPRQMADENARHAVPFIARIFRLLVRINPFRSFTHQ